MYQERQKHLQKTELPTVTSCTEQNRDIEVQQSGLMMIDLLRSRRGLDVTYAKDMIFAYLGFAFDGPNLAQRVNCSMNQIQLYHAFARYMIAAGLHFELFKDIDTMDPLARLSGLFSWAPDWSITRDGVALPHQDWISQLFNGPDHWYLSSGPSTYPEFVHDPPILACLGTKLDTVSQYTDLLSGLMERYVKNRHVASLFDIAHSNWLSNRPQSSEAFATAYAKLIEAIWLPSLVDEDIMNILPLFGFKTLQELELHTNPDKIKDSLHSIQYGIVHRIHIVLNHMELSSIEDMTPRDTSHIIARTVGGRIAIVPKWTQCGDIIAGLMLPSQKFFYPMFTFRSMVVIEDNLKACREKRSDSNSD